MIFSSLTFLFIFLPIVLFLYYIPLQKISRKNVLLLLASLIFYAIGEPIYIFLMIFSIMINFRMGILIDEAEIKQKLRCKKLFCIISIILNLGMLFIFKYENFAVTNLNKVFSLELESLELILPIGISFYTFQAMSYVIDVYRKKVPVQKNILDLGLYVAFFPQLIAGPIVRYSTVQEQILNRKVTVKKFSNGIKLFISGIGKKIILANNFAVISEYSFSTEAGELSILLAWLGAISYTLQIFFDFSGYSEMARGLAQMFGFEFERNFNYPYISKSITEFWRRWHISLGTWFRDYVYFPLGGSRVKSKIRLIFNLFVVWMLTGIWHGAAYQFIVWGMLYFVVLVFEKITKIPEKIQSKILSNIYRIWTMLLVILGWVIFGENGLREGCKHIKAMFGLYGNELTEQIGIFYLMENRMFFIIGILLSTPIFVIIDEKIKSKFSEKQIVVYDTIKTCASMFVLIVSVSYLAIGAHNPFIYFDF